MDYSVGTRTQFTYDLADRLVSQKEYAGTGQNGDTLRSSTDFTYADKTNYLTNVKHFSPIGTQNIAYKYGNINNGEMPDQVYSVSWNGVEKVTNKFDSLSRLSKRTVNGLATNYTYKDLEGNQTTTLVESINTGGISYVYDYDEVNNIKSVTVGNKKTTYEYDELNQLTRVNDPFENVTHVYTYNNGNIVYDLVYEYSVGVLPAYPLSATQYLYENATWSDILTGVKKSHFDNGVEIIDDRYSISSDTIGNITNLNGPKYSWLGRQLQSVSNSDNSKTTYSYNADGQRIAKAVNSANGDEYNYGYYYNGDILAGYKLVITKSDGSSTTHNVAFMYDENGEAFGFNYNGNDYYYVRNAQNDVVRIVDSANETVVLYQYDSWGKLLSCEDTSENDIVSFINPYTYRGYYYDSDTQLYYLNSRYYNPELCRYINADSISDNGAGVLGFNLFVYSANNPVKYSDPSGNFVISAIVGKIVGGAVVGGIVGAIAGAAGNVCSQLKSNGGNFRAIDKKAVGKAALVGGISGAVTGALSSGFGLALGAVKASFAAKAAVKIIGNGVIGAAGHTIDRILYKEKLTYKGQAKAFGISAGVTVGSMALSSLFNWHELSTGTKREKRELLGVEFTNRQIRYKEYKGTASYHEFLISSTDTIESVADFTVSIFVDIKDG